MPVCAEVARVLGLAGVDTLEHDLDRLNERQGGALNRSAKRAILAPHTNRPA